jgi:hypothetical protein
MHRFYCACALDRRNLAFSTFLEDLPVDVGSSTSEVTVPSYGTE